MIARAACGNGATIGTNPLITQLARYEIRPVSKRVVLGCYVVELGTTNASRSALRIGAGSVLSLTHPILDSVEYEISLSRRLSSQRRQIIPVALKAEVVRPADSLNFPVTFWTFCYRNW